MSLIRLTDNSNLYADLTLSMTIHSLNETLSINWHKATGNISLVL